MRERLQGLWRRFGAEIVAGLLFAVVIALVGRGGIGQFVVIYLIVAMLALALILVIVSAIRERSRSRWAGTLAILATLSLVSLPLGAAVNQLDVARAKAWCEQHTGGLQGLSDAERRVYDEANGAPMLADTHPEMDECYVTDRAAGFFGEGVYTPEAGWSYWD